ncbi:MAG: YraN family protein [Elusimicrobia bacterium RIFOXYA2_FULL_50_26]|nr:MAG: YraN family protein [Elusimicrobia bacterium RIFOXYA2_FULL_50_26]OGS25166.1 MAG: YraN family protein [Elusimicrobia bacterium RIFOXYB2_FULL_50_12]
MRVTSNSELGQRGEDAAAQLLLKKGYRLVARNYRTRYGEIDIIARKGGFLVFVEVKFRRSSKFGTPQEAVNARKQQHMIRSALSYVKQHSLFNESIRFDVLSIGPDTSEIIESAFIADSRYTY